MDPSSSASSQNINPAAFSYNIPPVDPKEDNTNIGFEPPPYCAVSPDDNFQVKHIF